MLNKQLIPANRDSNYQIKDCEKEFYHVKLVEEIPTADESQPIVDERIQIFSVEGFHGFLKNKSLFSFKREEIIHDPTFVKKEQAPEVKKQPVTVTLPDIEEGELKATTPQRGRPNKK